MPPNEQIRGNTEQSRDVLLQENAAKLNALREEVNLEQQQVETLIGNPEYLLFENMNPYEMLQTTPAAEEMYQRLRKEKNVPPTPTFAAFLERAKSDKDFARTYEYVLSNLNVLEKKDVGFSLEYRVRYTARKLTTLYCMYSGTNDARVALKDLRDALGEELAILLQNQDCTIVFLQEKNSLEITSNGKKKIVLLKQYREPSDFDNQSIERVQLSPLERKTWAENNERRREARYELIDNAVGRIEDVTIFNQGEVTHGLAVSRLQLRGLVSGLKPKKINIVYGTRQKYDYNPMKAEEVLGSSLNAEASQRVRMIPVRADIRQWARDEMLQAIDPTSGSRMILGFNPQIPDTESAEAPRNFDGQGGDWRAVGPYLFLGQHFGESIRSVAKSEKITEGSARQKLEQEYEALFGRKVVYVEKSPAFHLDVFVTFLPNQNGRPTVLIADFSETESALKELSPADRDRAEKQMVRSEFDRDHDSPDRIMEEWNFQHDIFNGLARYSTDVDGGKYRDTQQDLDEAAIWFTDKGFDVVRIPTGYMNADPVVLSPDQKTSNSFDEKLWQSYNNCLVEAYVDENNVLQKHAYIPSFGLPVEKKLVSTFNALGYEVHPVMGLQDAAYEYGSLNCLTSEFRSSFDRREPSSQHLLRTYKSSNEKEKADLREQMQSVVSALKEEIKKDPTNGVLYTKLEKTLRELQMEDQLIPVLNGLLSEKKLSFYGANLLIEKMLSTKGTEIKDLETVLQYMKDAGREIRANSSRIQYYERQVMQRKRLSAK